MRGHVSGGAETSTPIKNQFPIFTKRKSSMLEGLPRILEATTFSPVAFEIDDKETPVTKRVVIGEGLCSRSKTENERIGTDFGLPGIESIALVAAAEFNPLTIGSSVQQLEEPGFSGSFSGVAGGNGTECSGC